MASIAADDRDVERALLKIVTLAKKGGAEFHDDLIVKCVDRMISIEAPPESSGRVLVRLPWDCLVPLAPYKLALAEDDIVILSCEEGLTSAAVRLMEAVLELYNRTEKITEHRRRSPWPLIAAHPELLRYVTQRRGPIDASFAALLRPGREDELVLHSFFNTRFFSYQLGGGRYPALPVLMPIIDLFNHHINGAAYRDDQLADNRSLSITRSLPLPGTGNECFACYGPYDAFNTFLTYDFIDGRVPFVLSVAMTIDLPGLGSIRVGNVARPRGAGDLPDSVRDLRFYVPTILRRRRNHLDVSALFIPGPQSPEALRRILEFLIAEISSGHPKQRDLVLQAEEQILVTNETYYRALIACLRNLSPHEPLQGAIIENFIRMCELQLARIQVYRAYAEIGTVGDRV
jgi:hypothetical protein